MTEKDYYTCPMHPEIQERQPGKCPKCGGMDLVKKSEVDHGMVQHDHASMMATPEAAADFLHRFYIVSALLVPLAVFSEPAVMFAGMPDFASRSYIEFGIASVIFYFGLVFFEHAKHEINMKKYGMMTLVSMGVGAGYLFSAASTFLPQLHAEFYVEISTLIWILLFGHFLEAKSSTAAGDAMTEVAKLLPKMAHRIENGQTRDVELELLATGDVIEVKSGEKVAADGEIIKGSANFNESHLTGESRPVKKQVGDAVSAGSICLDGSVQVRLTRVGASSTIGQIKELISAARKTKPSVQKLADRAAGWLTFSALSVSLLALFSWSVLLGQPFAFAMTMAITVLVIACPHALGLAIPTVSTIATRLAVSNGVFIKDMAKIETVRRADYVVFDKTGTLTRGEFGVTDILPLVGTASELLSVAAAIEAHSSHVIASAIVLRAKEGRVKTREATSIKNLPGRGISAKIGKDTYYVGNARLMDERHLLTDEVSARLKILTAGGKTPVLVATTKRLIGIFALSDSIKDESKHAVSQLHKLGVKVAMLTGDTQEAADAVSRALGIDTVFAHVLPEDKYKHIRELQNQGFVVIMAGDGVNDAPALTQADAGVAIGAGTDVAVEAGDIILTQSNPQHLVRLIVLSRKVYRKMVENLFWAVGYNVLAIPAAAGVFMPLGFSLTPAVGALLMSMSSVIVVVNAMSLRNAQLDVPEQA